MPDRFRSAFTHIGEHIIDWFHITMRLTLLLQPAKTLAAERPDEGADASTAI